MTVCGACSVGLYYSNEISCELRLVSSSGRDRRVAQEGCRGNGRVFALLVFSLPPHSHQSRQLFSAAGAQSSNFKVATANAVYLKMSAMWLFMQAAWLE